MLSSGFLNRIYFENIFQSNSLKWISPLDLFRVKFHQWKFSCQMLSSGLLHWIYVESNSINEFFLEKFSLYWIYFESKSINENFLVKCSQVDFSTGFIFENFSSPILSSGFLHRIYLFIYFLLPNGLYILLCFLSTFENFLSSVLTLQSSLLRCTGMLHKNAYPVGSADFSMIRITSFNPPSTDHQHLWQ
jgi:hypothetical protein